jgi:methylglutaconyl-CoA hydratase
MTSWTTLDVTIDQLGVAHIVLSNGDSPNMVSATFLIEMSQVCDMVVEESVRAVALTAQGRTFSAGGDINEMLDLFQQGRQQVLQRCTDAAALIRQMTLLPMPTVCGVRGAAIGGGACLALACDVVVTAPSSQFGFIFTNIGAVAADMLAPWLLARRIGTRRTSRVLLDGMTLSGEQAFAWGLADEMVKEDSVDLTVAARASRWAKGAQMALRSSKQAVLRLEMTMADLDGQAKLEADLAADAFEGTELHEGLSAFREHRRPDFTS